MHETLKNHMGKTYKIITDNPVDLPMTIFRQISGRLAPVVHVDGKRVALGRYLFGIKKTVNINGNELDYRRENLKEFNMAEYNLTKRSYPLRKSGARGIYQLVNGKFKVAIHHNNDKIIIDKQFDSVEDAVKARKKLLKEYLK